MSVRLSVHLSVQPSLYFWWLFCLLPLTWLVIMLRVLLPFEALGARPLFRHIDIFIPNSIATILIIITAQFQTFKMAFVSVSCVRVPSSSANNSHRSNHQPVRAIKQLCLSVRQQAAIAIPPPL